MSSRTRPGHRQARSRRRRLASDGGPAVARSRRVCSRSDARRYGGTGLQLLQLDVCSPAWASRTAWSSRSLSCAARQGGTPRAARRPRAGRRPGPRCTGGARAGRRDRGAGRPPTRRACPRRTGTRRAGTRRAQHPGGLGEDPRLAGGRCVDDRVPRAAHRRTGRPGTAARSATPLRTPGRGGRAAPWRPCPATGRRPRPGSRGRRGTGSSGRRRSPRRGPGASPDATAAAKASTMARSSGGLGAGVREARRVVLRHRVVGVSHAALAERIRGGRHHRPHGATRHPGGALPNVTGQ